MKSSLKVLFMAVVTLVFTSCAPQLDYGTNEDGPLSVELTEQDGLRTAYVTVDGDAKIYTRIDARNLNIAYVVPTIGGVREREGCLEPLESSPGYLGTNCFFAAGSETLALDFNGDDPVLIVTAVFDDGGVVTLCAPLRCPEE